MLIRIPRRQFSHCLHAWHDDEAMTAALQAQIKPRRDHLLVRAPYVAWWNCLGALQAATFGPWGGAKRERRHSSMYAITTLATAINAMDNHPALRGAGVVGHLQQHVLPVWQLTERDSRDRSFSPMPVPGASFVVLRPKWAKVGRTDVTVWTGAGLVAYGEDPLAEERLHLSLVR